ncbi:MAG: P-loop NTPase [Chitinivibrionales bacterium]|nr:P-loop NTPase [Chitinivibrionales bacterium]
MNSPVIISCGGGKGGIGKSTIVAFLGTFLAQQGYRVGFVDADLGGANLHQYLGVRRPAKGLTEFLSGKIKNLFDASIETNVPNTWLICGSGDNMASANPKFVQKQKLIQQIKQLPADFILVDLGAGTNIHVTDFYAAYQYSLLLSDGLPASIENAYGFLKNGLMRGLMRQIPAHHEIHDYFRKFSTGTAGSEFVTLEEMIAACAKQFPREARSMKLWLHQKKNFLIVNMVREREPISRCLKFAEVVRKYLGISVDYIGYVIFSSSISGSVLRSEPIALSNQDAQMTACVTSLCKNLIALTRGDTS